MTSIALTAGGAAGRSAKLAALPAGILIRVLLMVVPIPAALLDVFFIVNIMI